eukprot:TRINITY_DN38856_c1_g1_i1.p2 TRINITY_DN38856_c1_g1~~TRINITY_DN38856_c1_g1_i1.p2  ORF type:complete len:233 (+),score=27.31 TRINITY_DN38856_c1_g1_i1:96-701(+)
MRGWLGPADSFLHGLLWFTTGFALASLLSFWHQQQMSQIVVKQDASASFGVFGQINQKQPTATMKTRVFLYEMEGDPGKQNSLLTKFNDEGVGQLLGRNTSNDNRPATGGSSVSKGGAVSSPITQEDLTVLNIDLKEGLDGGQDIDKESPKQQDQGIIRPRVVNYRFYLWFMLLLWQFSLLENSWVSFFFLNLLRGWLKYV